MTEKYNRNILHIHGISQNPDSKDYIMVLQDGYCEECGEKYANIPCRWCKSCQSSGNKKSDDFILKTQSTSNVVFKWIPYYQFNNIKEIGKGGFATVYSTIWKDDEEQSFAANKEVALKCLHNSQNITNELLNEV